MVVTKSELKKLKGFCGTVRQAEAIIRRKLTKPEKIQLGFKKSKALRSKTQISDLEKVI
jgi:hypothetical protein